MEVDREIAVGVNESILPQVGQKCLPVRSRSTGGAIVKPAEQPLGIVYLLLGHDNVDIDVFPARYVAMEKRRQGRSLEGSKPETRSGECLVQAAKFLAHERGMCAVNPPEILDRGSDCRWHSLPRHPIETLDKLRTDSVVLAEP
jgi:hypothetical protein